MSSKKIEKPGQNINLVDKLITFIYYRDLSKGIDFYEKQLGFNLEIDQKWCKIYQISKEGYLGIVDERKGMQNWNQNKTVQICIRVKDVEHWYRYCANLHLDNMSEIASSDELKIKYFVFDDPEGYQIEIQQAIK